MSQFDGLAENTNTNTPVTGQSPEGNLVQWVMTRVNDWRDARNSAYEKLWGEYYRIWRGRWIEDDKTRKSERSRLINPSLAQALEMTVAELEEATFGRDAWIDILDDAGDPDHSDIDGIARTFIDDMAEDKIPASIAACYLNGGLWGTLAGKVHVERDTVSEFEKFTDESGRPRRRVIQKPVVRVRFEPIEPMNLIPDPDGRTTEEMLGIAHEVKRPRSWLLQFAWGRKYAARSDTSRHADHDWQPGRADNEDMTVSNPNQVLVTEYHGKVPKRLLENIDRKPEAQIPGSDVLESAVIGAVAEPLGELNGDGEMVEAIVTIFDKHTLGRGIENPFMFKDRSIIACQFELVPGRFWGRGVMEKGYNPQKALDAGLRTRMDVMALIANPQLGVDATGIPKGFDLTLRPGKIWMTNGDPSKAIFPIAFPNLDPASFSQSSEMERMVQIGTGAMDTATPLAENRRNETATGTSLIAGTFVKRAKRSLRNITANFVEPAVRMILLRRMEFDPERYPADFKFRVVGTLGIVARELEQSQLTQMLSLVKEGSRTQGVLVEAIFDNTASPFKAKLVQAIREDAQPDPAEQKLQDLQSKAAELEVAAKQVDIVKTQSESQKIETDMLLNLAKIRTELSKPGVEDAKLDLAFGQLEKEFEELKEFRRQNDTAALKVIVEITRGNENDGRQNSTDK